MIFASDLSKARLSESEYFGLLLKLMHSIIIVIAHRQGLAKVLRLLYQHYPEQMTVSIASLLAEQVAILQGLIHN